MSSPVLSDAYRMRVREEMEHYPSKRSALLFALHAAQDEVGYISDEVINEVADLFDLNTADVAGVVTFYTMYKRRRPGRYLISLCTNVGCALFGADEAADRLREMMGPPHEATGEGLMSWEEVECLAFCSAAPAAQVNYVDVPHLTAPRAERLCRALRDGRALTEIVEELRGDAALPAPEAERA